MTPNPLHGAIDETQLHSATEGDVSEKPTMREALIDIAERAECTDDYDFRIDLEDRLKTIAETARAALAAEEESVLPCDVRLPPATTIRKGCKLSTLTTALKAREGQNLTFPSPKSDTP